MDQSKIEAIYDFEDGIDPSRLPSKMSVTIDIRSTAEGDSLKYTIQVGRHICRHEEQVHVGNGPSGIADGLVLTDRQCSELLSKKALITYFWASPLTRREGNETVSQLAHRISQEKMLHTVTKLHFSERSALTPMLALRRESKVAEFVADILRRRFLVIDALGEARANRRVYLTQWDEPDE